MRTENGSYLAPLNGVLVGAGFFSHYQAEAWKRIPEVRISAVCDLQAEKAEALAKEVGASRVYSDYREMLQKEKPDFVDVITRPDTHLEICTHAMETGAAVICQKPLAPNHSQALELLKRMKAIGRPFMVHENWRWQPWYRHIKQLLDQDVLGKPFQLYFRMRTGDGWPENAYLERQPYFRDYPRFLIFETGVHFIDAFRFLLGEVTDVYAQGARLHPGIRGEDSALLVLRFASGARAVLDANRYNEGHAADPRLTFGELRLDASKGQLEMDGNAALSIKALGKPWQAVEYPWSRQGSAGDSCHSLQRHFVQCLTEKRLFESHADDYVRTLAVVEAAYESMETELPVKPRYQAGL